MIDHRTLHIRLTNSCNADCSYCSSFADETDRMSFDEILKSVEFIRDKIYGDISKVYDKDSHLSIQYIGGEILTIDPDELSKIKNSVEAVFKPIFGKVISGVQSNLIGSKRRLLNLVDIFDYKIGTSSELGTKNRTVSNNSELYEKAFKKGLSTIKKQGVIPGVIFVVNEDSYKYALDFYNKSKLHYSSLTFRPIFNGGIDVNKVSNDMLLDTLLSVFNEWFMKGNIHVEPFSMLLSNLLNEEIGNKSCLGCPFQNDCIDRSLDLEANGDLFICLDTADSNQLKLGNALKGEVDEVIFNNLRGRKKSINKICSGCEIFKVCHGGCLSEVLSDNGSYLDKTPYCEVWKSLVLEMKKSVKINSYENSSNWFFGLK